MGEQMFLQLGKARREAGLTQAAVSEKTGIPLGTLRRWEQGQNEPDMGSLVQLADLYGASLDAMLCRPAVPNEGPVPSNDPALARLVANYTSMTAEGRTALVATSAALAAQFPQVASGVSAEKSA